MSDGQQERSTSSEMELESKTANANDSQQLSVSPQLTLIAEKIDSHSQDVNGVKANPKVVFYISFLPTYR